MNFTAYVFHRVLGTEHLSILPTAENLGCTHQTTFTVKIFVPPNTLKQICRKNAAKKFELVVVFKLTKPLNIFWDLYLS